VICAQNHDQIGNRAFGDRLPPEVRRLAAAVTLLAPQTPLLFMGEEHGETAPFQFFTDHDDPEIAKATREGRRREFARFASFASEEIPDPQAPETFERSKVDPASGDRELRAFYRQLLALRRRLPREVDVDVDERRRLLRVRRGDVELVANFEAKTAELVC
jgi:maltooligosyltrehalose trehalohydrolase